MSSRLTRTVLALSIAATTASLASSVDGIEFAESTGAANDYLIVALRNGPNKAAALAFLAYVQSDKAKAVLNQTGFLPPLDSQHARGHA